MNKYIIGLICVVLAGLLILLKAVPINIGCCKTQDGCADGTSVTEQMCTEVLDGLWQVNTNCNTDNGNCE